MPQRSSSAAIEQFLLGKVQVATVIDAEPASHETQLVGPLGYFSLCGKHIGWHLAGSLAHERGTTLVTPGEMASGLKSIFAGSGVNAVSLPCHP